MIELAFEELNYFAIIVCTLVAMIVGFIWYNPKTFFLIWWKAIGKSEKDLKVGNGSMGTVWTLTVVSAFVQPLFLALVLQLVYPNGASAWIGVQIAVVIWVGFIAPTYLMNKLFAGHGYRAWAIETGNHLVNLVLFGLILGAWQ